MEKKEYTEELHAVALISNCCTRQELCSEPNLSSRICLQFQMKTTRLNLQYMFHKSSERREFQHNNFLLEL